MVYENKINDKDFHALFPPEWVSDIGSAMLRVCRTSYDAPVCYLPVHWTENLKVHK